MYERVNGNKQLRAKWANSRSIIEEIPRILLLPISVTVLKRAEFYVLSCTIFLCYPNSSN